MNEHCGRELVHWVGVDVSKDTFDAGLVLAWQQYPETSLSAIPAETFGRSKQGVRQFLKWLGRQGVEVDLMRVVMEATGHYSAELTVWMLEQRPSLRPAIAAPTHTAHFIKSLGLRNKTDRLEARALGFYGVERQPKAYEPPTPERAELRELSRCRDSLVQQRTALKNQMKRDTGVEAIRQLNAKRLAQFDADIASVEQAMKTLVAEHDELKQDVALLTSIHSIAFLSATMILAELGDLRHFEKARQLTAFAGMSPRHRQSGSSVHGKSRLCKQGNPRIRQGLYLCAMVAIQGNPPLRKTYQKLIAQGKPKMVALGAVMRKLLVLMRAVLISGKPYDPNRVHI